MPSVPTFTNVRETYSDRLICVIGAKVLALKGKDDTVLVNGIIIEFQHAVTLEVFDATRPQQENDYATDRLI